MISPKRPISPRRGAIAGIALAILGIGALAYSQQIDHFVIGKVEYYGYAGLNLHKIEAAIPLRAGKTLSTAEMGGALNQTAAVVRKLTGRPPTDTEPVCCDARGAWFVYVGLPGKSTHTVPYNPTPKGNAKLPASIVGLHDQIADSLLHAIRTGAKEDDSKGYFLSSDPGLRKIQDAIHDYAVDHGPLIIKVLQTSADPHEREAAAEALGYAEQSPEQLAALAHAGRDPDSGVRNNAIRALTVLAHASPKTASQIPSQGFIDLLSSGSWSDRNKSCALLETLTRFRDPHLLSALRTQALTPLIEMAHWDPGHAGAAEFILGRIAGIPEDKLQKMANADQAVAIIHAAKQTASR
ncbi:MAG TPA: HEAT repeat domain-containing protein [Capsulimonadaceae bacterium]|nr:HEAT repeat domain-containing protein [Capsulimonadaceae bacterium]